MTHHLVRYLKQDFTAHLFDYLLLITAGVFFLISVNIFKGERLLEFILLLAFTTFYIIWGIYHHIVEDDLHLKVVIEYILIGFTIMFLLKALILP